MTRPQDRETLDATLSAPAGAHEIRSRSELGGERIPLTDRQFMDLITVHVGDFIEQVRRMAVASGGPSLLRCPMSVTSRGRAPGATKVKTCML